MTTDRYTNDVSGTINGDLYQIGSVNGSIQVGVANYSLRDLAYGVGNNTAGTPDLPSQLIDAKFRTVPFHGREDEMIRLRKWGGSSSRRSIAIVLGPGGSGKTRLSLEYAAEAREQGWRAYSCSQSRPIPELSSVSERWNDEKVLVIVEYADRWEYEKLTQCIGSLFALASEKLRLILVSREGRNFTKHIEKDFDQLAQIETMDLSGRVRDAGPVFQLALRSFAEGLGLDDALCGFPSVVTSDLGNYLDIHMLALTTVYECAEGSAQGRTMSDLSSGLMRHERRQWGDDPDGTFEQVVLVSTMLGPVDTVEDAYRVLQLAALADNPAAADILVRQHRARYGSSGAPFAAHVLRPLQPDRFAEDFVASCLEDEYSQQRLRRVISAALADQRLWPNLTRAVRLMSSSGLRFDHVAHLLLELMADHPPLAGLSDVNTLSIAANSLEPASAMSLLSVLDSDRGERSEVAGFLALRIAEEIPPDEDVHEQFLAWYTAARHLASAGEFASAVVPITKSTSLSPLLETGGDERFADEFYARMLAQLAEIIWESGISDDAAIPARAAVSIYRRLQSAGRLNYPNALADALMQLGTILAECDNDLSGGLEFTREAVGIRTRVPPETISERAGLVLTYHNLGTRLLNIGQIEDAYIVTSDCIEHSQLLFEEQPREYARLHAAVLVNHSLISYNRGDLHAASCAAEDAVSICREYSIPSEQGIRDLARSLSTLGYSHILGERYAEAESALAECVRLYDTLADVSPAGYTAVLCDEEERLRRLRIDFLDRQGVIGNEQEVVRRLENSGLLGSHFPTKRRLALTCWRAGASLATEQSGSEAIGYLQRGVEAFESIEHDPQFSDHQSYAECLFLVWRLEGTEGINLVPDNVLKAASLVRENCVSDSGALIDLRLYFATLCEIYQSQGATESELSFYEELVEVDEALLGRVAELDRRKMLSIAVQDRIARSNAQLRAGLINESVENYWVALERSEQEFKGSVDEGVVRRRELILRQLVRAMRVHSQFRNNRLSGICDEWVDLSRRIQDSSSESGHLLVRCLSECCVVMSSVLGRHAKAVILGEEATHLAEQRVSQGSDSDGETHDLALALGYLADAYAEVGDWYRALKCLFRGYRLFNSILEKNRDAYTADFTVLGLRYASHLVRAESFAKGIKIAEEVQANLNRYSESEFVGERDAIRDLLVRGYTALSESNLGAATAYVTELAASSQLEQD